MGEIVVQISFRNLAEKPFLLRFPHSQGLLASLAKSSNKVSQEQLHELLDNESKQTKDTDTEDSQPIGALFSNALMLAGAYAAHSYLPQILGYFPSIVSGTPIGYAMAGGVATIVLFIGVGVPKPLQRGWQVIKWTYDKLSLDLIVNIEKYLARPPQDLPYMPFVKFGACFSGLDYVTRFVGARQTFIHWTVTSGPWLDNIYGLDFPVTGEDIPTLRDFGLLSEPASSVLVSLNALAIIGKIYVYFKVAARAWNQPNTPLWKSLFKLFQVITVAVGDLWMNHDLFGLLSRDLTGDNYMWQFVGSWINNLSAQFYQYYFPSLVEAFPLAGIAGWVVVGALTSLLAWYCIRHTLSQGTITETPSKSDAKKSNVKDNPEDGLTPAERDILSRAGLSSLVLASCGQSSAFFPHQVTVDPKSSKFILSKIYTSNRFSVPLFVLSKWEREMTVANLAGNNEVLRYEDSSFELMMAQQNVTVSFHPFGIKVPVYVQQSVADEPLLQTRSVCIFPTSQGKKLFALSDALSSVLSGLGQSARSVDYLCMVGFIGKSLESSRAELISARKIKLRANSSQNSHRVAYALVEGWQEFMSEVNESATGSFLMDKLFGRKKAVDSVWLISNAFASISVPSVNGFIPKTDDPLMEVISDRYGIVDSLKVKPTAVPKPRKNQNEGPPAKKPKHDKPSGRPKPSSEEEDAMVDINALNEPSEQQKLVSAGYDSLGVFLSNLIRVVEKLLSTNVCLIAPSPRIIKTRCVLLAQTSHELILEGQMDVRNIPVYEKSDGTTSSKPLCSLLVGVVPAVENISDLAALDVNQTVTADWLRGEIFPRASLHECPHWCFLNLKNLKARTLSRFMLGVSIIDISLRAIETLQTTPVSAQVRPSGEKQRWGSYSWMLGSAHSLRVPSQEQFAGLSILLENEIALAVTGNPGQEQQNNAPIEPAARSSQSKYIKAQEIEKICVDILVEKIGNIGYGPDVLKKLVHASESLLKYLHFFGLQGLTFERLSECSYLPCQVIYRLIRKHHPFYAAFRVGVWQLPNNAYRQVLGQILPETVLGFVDKCLTIPADEMD